MPADALTYALCASELNEKLSIGKIGKIIMPSPDTIALSIRAGGQNFWLLISANASLPRMHLTKASFETPAVAPRFLMHLRKHLAGGIIEEIAPVPFERIVEIKIRAYNELLVGEQKKLIVEIMGKHSNIILVNASGTISDSIKHISEDVSTKRQVMSGLPYHLPPAQSERFDVRQKEEIRTRLASFEGGNLERFLASFLSGLAISSIKEAVFGAFGSNKSFETGLKEPEIERVIEQLGALYDFCDVCPCALSVEGRYRDFFVRPYESAVFGGGKLVFFDSLSEAMDAFYNSMTLGQVNAGRRSHLLAIISGAEAKSQRKLGSLLQKQEDALDFEEDKKRGDLILSNIYRIRRGDSQIEVEDFFSKGELVRINIDERKSPQANAQSYYKLYNKKKTALNKLSGFIDELKSTLEYLESLVYFAENASSDQEFAEIGDELCRLGFARKKTTRTNKKQKPAKSEEITYKGYRIFVGKSSLANDELVKKSSASSIWLHASKIHGSHVVIENNSPTQPPEEVITYAAQLAAFHSKAKQADKVAVDYTLVKNVKKPPNAPPGKVIYGNQRTICVTPKE